MGWKAWKALGGDLVHTTTGGSFKYKRDRRKFCCIHANCVGPADSSAWFPVVTVRIQEQDLFYPPQETRLATGAGGRARKQVLCVSTGDRP